MGTNYQSLRKEKPVVKVLFVCLGNICRSPLAEGLFRHHANAAGLDEGPDRDVFADSAGTGSWHAGNPPDKRSVAVAGRHGIDIAHQRARQVEADDFERFDYILAMDRDNLEALHAVSDDVHRGKIRLLMSFASDTKLSEVPDPYFFRDEVGFARVFDAIEEGVRGFLDHIHEVHFKDRVRG